MDCQTATRPSQPNSFDRFAAPLRLRRLAEPGDVRLHGTRPLREGATTEPRIVFRSGARHGGTHELIAELTAEILRKLGDEDPLGCYELASALVELDLIPPAVKLLETAITLGGATIGCCELMGKCMAALGHHDTAIHWFMRPLEDASLDGESMFELVRQASKCHMMLALAKDADDR